MLVEGLAHRVPLCVVQEALQTVAIVVAARLVQADRRPARHAQDQRLFGRDVQGGRDLLDRRLAAELAGQLARGLLDPPQQRQVVAGDAHRARQVREGTRDALAESTRSRKCRT